jgi:hypothetical protein
MGPEFTLLRFDSAVDAAAPERAARDRGLPLKVLDVERPATATFDGARVLLRPANMWPGAAIACRPIRWC